MDEGGPGFLNRECEGKRRLVKDAPSGKGLACIVFVGGITGPAVGAIAEIFFQPYPSKADLPRSLQPPQAALNSL